MYPIWEMSDLRQWATLNTSGRSTCSRFSDRKESLAAGCSSAD
jgi:hypothetical protein